MKKNHLCNTRFIGADENTNHYFRTCCSDYTAAIFAYCLGAESVTIWKDVPEFC
jgi:aspartate kinase